MSPKIVLILLFSLIQLNCGYGINTDELNDIINELRKSVAIYYKEVNGTRVTISKKVESAEIQLEKHLNQVDEYIKTVEPQAIAKNKSIDDCVETASTAVGKLNILLLNSCRQPNGEFSDLLERLDHLSEEVENLQEALDECQSPAGQEINDCVGKRINKIRSDSRLIQQQLPSVLRNAKIQAGICIGTNSRYLHKNINIASNNLKQCIQELLA